MWKVMFGDLADVWRIEFIDHTSLILHRCATFSSMVHAIFLE